jgi:uncharacterized protein YjbJ (UPF0337 family)
MTWESSEGNTMGIDDKANLTVIHHIGPAKTGTGQMAGDEDPTRGGQHEQAQAKLQEAREQAKDGFAKE